MSGWINPHGFNRNWGLTEYDGPEKISNFMHNIEGESSILFVGANGNLDIIEIAKKLPNRCTIGISDKFDLTNHYSKDVANLRIFQYDFLEGPCPEWDCIVAFGVISKRVIWKEKAEIALLNWIDSLKKGGLLAISMHEKYAIEFERTINNQQIEHLMEKSTDYPYNTAWDKLEFFSWRRSGWNVELYDSFERGIDAHKDYLDSQEKRTNFYLTK